MDRDGWSGWAAVGGMIMVIVGVFRALSGFIGLFNDQWIMRGFTGYYVVNSTGLAWWTLIVGLFLFLAGLAVLAGEGLGPLGGHRLHGSGGHLRPASGSRYSLVIHDPCSPGLRVLRPGGQ